MKTKYQIFVSSTYEDLKEERDLVIKAILEMGHIPVGMEMFSAADDQQWKLIQSQIDDSDYYIVISAFRYGSFDGDMSYTEKEYNYAVSIGVPTLGFLINETAVWNPSKVDKDSVRVQKLADFKESIKKKLIGFWNDKNDLYGKVSIALMKQFNTNPRVGWIRADQHNGPEILKEISRLSKENSELRNQVERFNVKQIQEQKEKIENVLNTLKHNKRKISFCYKNSTIWEDKTDFTLFQLFNYIAPDLMIEISTKQCSIFLALVLRPNKEKDLRETWPTPSNAIASFLADLNVLELIAPSSKKHKLEDDNKYWTLTGFGKEIYRIVRQEFLRKNLPTVDESFE